MELNLRRKNLRVNWIQDYVDKQMKVWEQIPKYHPDSHLKMIEIQAIERMLDTLEKEDNDYRRSQRENRKLQKSQIPTE